jgi:hypothetical protein
VENAEEFVEMDPLHYKGMEITLVSHERLRVQVRQGAAIRKTEGWREAPEWLHSRKLHDFSSGTPLAGSASRFRCPADAGGQFPGFQSVDL